MQRVMIALAMGLAVLAASRPARACMAEAPIVLTDVAYADVVVVGRITDYRVIRNARFTIIVDEVLLGGAPDRLSVTWTNSTFEAPRTMPEGPFLIALRSAASPAPPLRGPSATILPNPDPSVPTVLQAPCSEPFIFPAASKDAQKVRRLLAAPPSG